MSCYGNWVSGGEIILSGLMKSDYQAKYPGVYCVRWGHLIFFLLISLGDMNDDDLVQVYNYVYNYFSQTGL